MPPRGLTAALAALACLAFADVASAAGVTLGSGRHPDVAVDERNTAHIVWDAIDDGPDRILYCNVPRTSKGCTNPEALTPPLEAIGQSSHVFALGGGRILVASVRCCGPGQGTNVIESGDGGLTFGPPRVVGNYELGDEVALGPGESLLTASPARVQHSALTGPAATTRAELDAGFPVPTYGEVGTHNGTTPVFVHSDGDDTTYHVGDPAADLNDPAGWAGPTVLPGGGEIDVESNPQGLQLLQEGGKPGARFYGARKFDGAAFTPVVRVTEAGSPREAGLGGTPWGGGSFYAAWIDNGAPDRFRWARSANGFNWSEPESVFAGADADDAFSIRIAGAPDGRAFAVWDQNKDKGFTKGILLPAKGPGPPIDALRAGQYEFRLFAPFPCTAGGERLDLSVRVAAGKKVSKSRRVTVTGVQFTLDRNTKVNDTKAPYRAGFDTSALAAGSSHSLRGFVAYRPASGGKTKVATLRATGLICK